MSESLASFSQITQHWDLLIAPFCIGVLLVITHVTFGREVLQRGIIFIDLTLAQVAACGVVLGTMLGLSAEDTTSWWLLQLVATAAAVGVALLLAGIEKQLNGQHQEAIIGAVYAVSASLVIILLANSPHAFEQRNELLSGQILWLDISTLIYVLPLYGVLLTVWWLASRHAWGRWLFYPLLAILVTSSVQLIGLYLVFATLILPALAVVGLRHNLLFGWLLGIFGYALGLILSLILDWPSGPAIVVSLGTLTVLTGLIRLGPVNTN